MDRGRGKAGRRGVYYNEFNKQKAAWLRHLIEEGVIAHGFVDERPIQAVQPEDLDGFVQCHFFAGIGLWSLCLRNAGWPDDRPVWTGSCPCGPFSKAGNRLGFDDPRHLWPQWFRLILERRPVVLFGEQSDEALSWLDLVQADLESRGYAVGPAVIPAAGYGGAHGRHRIGFVADADNTEWWTERAPWNDGRWPAAGRIQSHNHAEDDLIARRLADANSAGRIRLEERDKFQAARLSAPRGGDNDGRGAVRGLAAADFLFCRDDRWRPVEPGTFPLVDADSGGVELLRGYGDAIDVEAFTNLIGAYLDCAPSRAAA
jgi:DNA (cytosine-5)-methyltransferase 1